MTMNEKILEVDQLTVAFTTQQGLIVANDNVAFSQARGEWLAIMGPSGSGKSVLAKSISGIFTGQPGVIGGKIIFQGNDLLEGLAESVHFTRADGRVDRVSKKSHKWAKRHRRNLSRYARNKFAYIFQNPYDALNPFFTVRRHLKEAFQAGGERRGDVDTRSIDLLTSLEIAAPKNVLKLYPHELSGGMAQRVVIAMALAQQTAVIIADECTTSLDPVSAVSTIEALQQAREVAGCSILFITHDLAIAETYSDRILKFERGRFVSSTEFGSA